MDKKKDSPGLVISICMFIAFLLIFYVFIIAFPFLIISFGKLVEVNKEESHSNVIFFFGVAAFIISKFIDFRLTAKKSNSLCWLFFIAFIDAVTPALFIFSMLNMDKYLYYFIVGGSCILLAVIYSMKALSLDKQVTERKTGLSEMELVMQDKARAEKLLEKIDSNYTAKLTPPKGIDAQVKWFVVTTIIAGLIICLAKLLF